MAILSHKADPEALSNPGRPSPFDAAIKMGILDLLLEQTAIYSLWQAPFVAEKLAPVLKHNDLRAVRRVLDVGCGPGTNTKNFSNQDYLGIDINPHYIESAKRKHDRAFLAADVTTYDNHAGKFDFILVNSFLHHINEKESHNVLSRLTEWLTPDGYLHILEMILPDQGSIARFLAKWDRGKCYRPLEEWRTIFEKHLDIVVFEPFALKRMGTILWKMVYCKGRIGS